KTYLYYEVDTVSHKFYLLNKNQKFSKELQKRLNEENTIGLQGLHGTALGNSINILAWNYDRPTKDRIVLSGKDAKRDSVIVVMDRLDRTYLTGKEWYMENNKYTYR